MSLAAGMGIASGLASLYGQYQAGQAGDEERDYWADLNRARLGSDEMRGMEDVYKQSMGALKDLPALLSRRRQGALASAAQTRYRRLQENLAPSGATQASSVGFTAGRGIASDIEQQRQQGEYGQAQTMQGLRGQVSSMGQALLNAKYPSAGAVGAGLSDTMGTYQNWLRPLAAGAMGYGMGNYYGGGSGAGVGGGAEAGGGFNPMPWFG